MSPSDSRLATEADWRKQIQLVEIVNHSQKFVQKMERFAAFSSSGYTDYEYLNLSSGRQLHRTVWHPLLFCGIAVESKGKKGGYLYF